MNSPINSPKNSSTKSPKKSLKNREESTLKLLPKLAGNPLFKLQCYISGKWCDGEGGETDAVINPATSEVIGYSPKISETQLSQAMIFSQQAQTSWQAQTAKHRSALLQKWYELIVANQESLAQIITTEQGKPLAEAIAEVNYAASYVQWYAEQAKRVYGEVIPAHQAQLQLTVVKQAVGVCAAITPWNFPAAMIARKAAPALAAGCAIIVKPAPATPFTAFALASLAEQAGIPAGLFNVVTGDAVMIGEQFCQNPIIKKLSFTGSTAVGQQLIRQSASNVTKLSLELGGNAPFIVMDDAIIEDAVDGLIQSKFRNSGQTCVCANRIYVHRAIYAEFCQQFTNKVAKLNLGNGFDNDVHLGPLINQAAVEKVQQHVDDAIANGATLVCGGKATKGLFYPATIITNASHGMRFAREETFGPVAAIIAFDDIEQVINYANDTPFGLAAYVYSQNVSHIHRFGAELAYGMVGINTGLISTEVAPFGGIKASGYGREGGKEGIEEYLVQKYLCQGR
ncbi:NAD-dependent succinate-semialdehyde dehydrogenase [Shewanella maritima]|uniref:NAD-dependent succinate-semialdehyde dehydrogenase n=1 Tax=Shewanella maritima TaxID=2520507 RepID=A0A411PF52_9GAMM|nr:NAD-dependent succinate-semialdehyde dehydrogenase [Shewanella maritima]QBF82104.1 NAD-dependent succinate-semialdehyde dehydrogenase [Shewanella maritima]